MFTYDRKIQLNYKTKTSKKCERSPSDYILAFIKIYSGQHFQQRKKTYEYTMKIIQFREQETFMKQTTHQVNQNAHTPRMKKIRIK